MNKLSNFIIEFRWVSIAIVTIMTIFFTYQFKFLKVDSNIVDALPANDSIVKLFKDVGKRFGGNEIGLVIIENKNVFEHQVLDHIQQVTDTLSEIEGITSVTSITNMTHFNVEGDNFEVSNLIDPNKRPQSKLEAENLRSKITKDEMVAGKLVSKDGTATIILFTFQNNIDVKAVADKVVSKIEALKLPEKYYFAGASFFTKYVADVISVDLIKLIPISFLLIALVLFLSFRSIRGVVLPLLTAGLAIVWSIGTFVLMGHKLSMVTNNVPIIILAVGSAYTIHVLNRINQYKEGNQKTAILKGLSVMIVPVALTAMTTMIGFLSFLFGAYLSMIKDFGILAALGTLYSALLALFFVPAILSFLPDKKVRIKPSKSNKKSSVIDYILLVLYNIISKYPYRVLSVWLILILIGFLGIYKIERSVSVSEYFKSDHPASLADGIMENKFGGSKPIFVVFKGDMQSPELLKGMIGIEEHLNKSPYISNPQSIADVVVKLNKAFSGEEKIPDDKSQIEQLWFLFGEQNNISQLVTEDLDQGVIIAKFNNKGQLNIDRFTNYMDEYFKKHPSNNYTVEITGMPYVNVRLDKSLVKSQLGSLIIAIVLVIVLVSLLFRSLREGLYAALPIISTIIILYGLMGLTGIPLNVATVLVASVAMGIGIDYSIHFISHFNHLMENGQNLHEVIKETMIVSGKAILINCISVAVGFIVLAFSELVPMIYFGVLIAFSMFGSSMGALTLLPVTLLIGKKAKQK